MTEHHHSETMGHEFKDIVREFTAALLSNPKICASYADARDAPDLAAEVARAYIKECEGHT